MVKIVFDAPAPLTPKTGDAFIVSPAAGTRLTEILTKHPTHTFLRIVVKGGGCNGYSYFFKLDTEKKDTDQFFTHPKSPTAQVCIDEKSLPLLWGTTLQYEDSVEKAQFTLDNPQATSQCGCGNSFGL